MVEYPVGIRSRIIKNINGLSMHILEAGFEESINNPSVILLQGVQD